jgi:fructokinase
MPRQLLGAIEAGGTKFVCAVGYGCDEILDEARIATSTPEETLAQVLGFFERVTREAGDLLSIGVATFGPVDVRPQSASFGQILSTPKRGWSGTNLVRLLQERFQCRVGIDTDVNAAALAEARLGAGMTTGSLAYITVGTGIGGGAVINGRTLKGRLHPEMGHLYVRRDPQDDRFAGVCPFHADCVEGLASGPAILSRWRANVDEWPLGHPGFELIGAYLGQLAASIMLTLSCERIVFGGGVMGDGRLLPYIRRSVVQSLNGYLPFATDPGSLDHYITVPRLGHRSGLAGAFVLASESTLHPDRF